MCKCLLYNFPENAVVEPNPNSYIIRFNYSNLGANEPGFFIIDYGPVSVSSSNKVFDSRNEEVKFSLYDFDLPISNYRRVKLIPKTSLAEVGNYTLKVNWNYNQSNYTEKQTAFISPNIHSYDLQRLSILMNNHKSMLLFQGIYNCQDLGDLVDNLSKFLVPQGFQVILYENPGWTGRTRNFTQDTIRVANGFNTRNCSIRVLWTSGGILPI